MNRELRFVVRLQEGEIVESFTVDDTHKARNIRNEVEGNGLPRIHARASALCGTCRIEHLKEQNLGQPASGCTLPFELLRYVPGRYNLHSWSVGCYTAT